MMIPRLSFGVAGRIVAFCLLVCVSSASHGQADGTQVAANSEELARAGRTVEAENLATSYLKTHSGSIPVNVVLGELAAYRRAWLEAIAYYDAALSGDPANQAAERGEQNAVLALALHQRNAGDGLAALATLEQARQKLPGNVAVLLALAVEAQSLHRYARAQAAAEEAIAVQPENARALYIAAGIQFDAGHSSRAVSLYQKYLTTHPYDASARFGLGRALRVQQRNEEAERELRESIRLQPVQTEAYFQLGLIEQEIGKTEEAKSDFNRVIARMPQHAGALTGLAEIVYHGQKYEQAREYLQRAVAADDEYEKAHYLLGLTLRRLGHIPDAKAQLQIAMQLAAKQQGKGSPVLPQ